MGALLGEASSMLSMWESLTLKVGNERRKACRLELVSGSMDGVFDEGEFGGDLVEFESDAAAVVIVAVVMLDLCDHVPVVKV